MGRPVTPKPEAADSHAWALAAQLPDREQMAARVALRALAGHGWSTELNAQLTGEQIDTLTTREFFGLRRLWEAALARRLRSHPVPTRSAEFNARRSRPPTVDERAWELALSLRGADATLALWALRQLDVARSSPERRAASSSSPRSSSAQSPAVSGPSLGHDKWCSASRRRAW